MRVGIIGTNWGRMHVGGFRAAGAEVAALCGRDPDKTRAIAAQEGVPLATDDVARLCDAVDVVVVTSPDALHAAHVTAALRAGRHVLCEKPLTRTTEESAALVALARTLPAAQRFAVCFPYRMLPPVAGLARWLRGRTATRHAVVTVLNSFASAEGHRDDGPLLGASGDFGGVSHPLDASLWLVAQEPAWVQAALTGRPVHSAALQVGFATGARLDLTHVPAPEPGIAVRCALVGDGWQAQFEGGYVPALGGWRIGPATAFEGGRWREVGPRVEPAHGRWEPWAEAHAETARAFLRWVRGDAPGALAQVDDGHRVQRVLDAALRSEREGRRVTDVA